MADGHGQWTRHERSTIAISHQPSAMTGYLHPAAWLMNVSDRTRSSHDFNRERRGRRAVGVCPGRRGANRIRTQAAEGAIVRWRHDRRGWNVAHLSRRDRLLSCLRGIRDQYGEWQNRYASVAV